MLKPVMGGTWMLALFAAAGPARADFLTTGSPRSEFGNLLSFLGQSSQGSNDPGGFLDGIRSLQNDLGSGSNSIQNLLSQLAADLSNPSTNTKADLAAAGLFDLLLPRHGWKADVLAALLVYEILHDLSLFHHHRHHHHVIDPPIYPLSNSSGSGSGSGTGGHHHHHHHHQVGPASIASIAPEPASLTLLALGALAACARRRRASS